MFGEGFPFDLVLFTLMVFILLGVNATKAERKKNRSKVDSEPKT